MFDCTCNTQNSLLLNQHNGDDAPQERNEVGTSNFGEDHMQAVIPALSARQI
jgi:hypothetical protein